MKNIEFYEQYEERLTNTMVEICTSKGLLSGQLYIVEELDDKWTEIAAEYMADAVPELNEYPSVAIAWAAYLGMGVAAVWDTAWEEYREIDSFYDKFSKPRGFDEMDEFILEEMLSLELNSDMGKNIEDLFRSCAQKAISMIRKEGIEAQTTEAFYMFAHTAKVFYKIGVSIELQLLGYKYEKVDYLG